MIQEVPEFPLVVTDKIQEYKKTKQAVVFLKLIRAWADVKKVIIHYIYVTVCTKKCPHFMQINLA